MSIYRKGKLITSKYNKGKEINKGWRKGHLVFSKSLYNFLANIKQMGIIIDETAYSKAYYSIDNSILNSAKIILLPFVTDTGIVYGMDNRTGDVIPFTFSRATGATLFDIDNHIQLVGNDVPRIDYGNYSNEAKILIEKTTTNLYAYSNKFNVGGGWSVPSLRTSCIETDEKAYGFDNFWRLTRLVSDNNYSLVYTNTFDLNDEVTVSFISKNDTSNRLQCGYYANNGDGWGDIQSMATSSILLGNATTGGSNSLRSFTNIDGTVLCSFSRKLTDVNTTTSNMFLYVDFASNNESDKSNLLASFQLTKNRVSSYIPTNGSAVTRSADLLSYDLAQDCTVYLKTTKQETTLNKLEGTWNIHDDLNNEGIMVLAII